MYRNSNYSRKISSIIPIENELDEKYKDYINKFKENNNTKYDIRQINSICDSFIAMTNLTNTGINKDEFYKFCLKTLNITFGEGSIYIMKMNKYILEGIIIWDYL